jgi:hypothetical protein
MHASGWLLAKPCIRKKLLAKKKKRRVTRCERAGLGFGGHYSYLVLHFEKLSVNSLCIALNKVILLRGFTQPPHYWRDYLRHPSTYGRACAFDAKKGLRHRRKMHVSRFQEGSKKNFEKMDFWFQVYARMIEKLKLKTQNHSAKFKITMQNVKIVFWKAILIIS